MWISNIKIKNFRKAPMNKFISIELKEGLNLLVGENNVGKTSIIESIALCLNYGSPERNIWLKEDDFNCKDESIEIIVEFSGLSESQEATFLQALVIDEAQKTHKLKFHFIFEMKGDRIQPTIKCGELDATSNPFDLLKYLRAMYLGALRDVNIEFNPGYRSRIGKILKSRFGDKDGDFLKIFRDANELALKHKGEKNPVKLLENETNENINKLSLKGDNNRICLHFVEQEQNRILTNVEMKLEEKGLDIKTNGLGYNNLIFISTILTELNVEEKINPHTFNCLLVEEPEAHLHPQLQSLLLEFLQTEYKNIQVILTTHSPTIASIVDLDNLNILNQADDEIQGVLLKNAGLDNDCKEYLEKYLDVTKSQLFFARRIIFVEGITEAILIKDFWNSVYSKPEDKFDRQGIEIVNIQGVAFNPYVDLIKNVFKKTKVKSVIITDDDRGTGRACPVDKRFLEGGVIKSTEKIVSIFNSSPISSRAIKLKDSVDLLKKEGYKTEIYLAKKTFEVEFGIANKKNKKLLEKLIGLEEKELETFSDISLGVEVWKRIVESDLKSKFAMNALSNLSGKIFTDKGKVEVPQYFKDAFEYLKND